MGDSESHKEMRFEPNWAGMATDLLEEIATRLVIIEDFTAFRGVCTSWRTGVKKEKYVLNSLVNGKIPLLLLPVQDDGEFQLCSLSERRICGKVSLLDEAKGKRWFDVGFGWILAVDDGCGDVRLFKCFSRTKAIQLPCIKTLKSDYVVQVVLSDDPATSDNFAWSLLMMASAEDDSYWWWFFRNGDEKWTKKFIGARICETMCFYDTGKVCMIDLNGFLCTLHIEIKLFICNGGKVDHKMLRSGSHYLVKSTKGELLLISRHRDTCHFTVFEVSTSQRAYWEAIARNDLRGDAIFLSDNSPTCVAAVDYPSVVKANCIYFANDFEIVPDPLGGKDMGIYNIADQSLETFNFDSFHSYFAGQPAGKSRSPLWVLP